MKLSNVLPLLPGRVWLAYFLTGTMWLLASHFPEARVWGIGRKWKSYPLDLEGYAVTDKISWKSEFITGVAKIDAQHHSLIDLLGKLQESLSQGLQSRTTGAALRTVVEYTQTHFKDEEALMARIEYSDIERHSRLHKDLLNEVVAILKTLKAGKDYATVDLIKFLNHWVIDHILQEDTKIAAEHRKAHSHQLSTWVILPGLAALIENRTRPILLAKRQHQFSPKIKPLLVRQGFLV